MEGFEGPYTGKCMLMVVPLPTVLSTSIRPFQLSTSRLTMASPSPEPLVVVENRGSKILGSRSGAIPDPSSDTRIRPGPTRTSTRVAPAMRAFSSRFITASFTSSVRAAPTACGSLTSSTSQPSSASR